MSTMGQLNEDAKEALSEKSDELIKEIREAFGISEEEYRELVNYGRWLNEA